VNKKYIILLGGKAGVGKTTTANILQKLFEDCGVSSCICNFANTLKKVAKESFGWDGEKDDKGRRLLQEIGKCGRNYYEDIWVDSILTSHFMEDYDIIIIDDWRFLNESTKCKNFPYRKTILVYISAEDREILKGTPAYGDVSETSLPDNTSMLYDYVIYNSLDNCPNIETLGEVVEKTVFKNLIKKRR